MGLLTAVVQGLVGQRPQSDQFGSAPVRVAVIETDGSVEPTDNFKACADRMTDLGLDIFRNTFDDLYYDEFFKNCVDTVGRVPDACRDCAFVQICAGGPMSTRYSVAEGFGQRTVYCKEFKSMFAHVDGWLRAQEVI
ncbi:hypothetical protein ACTMTJ_42020 [Phytohabitans sp. LJ34]|uniref:hypothetical protein n=1 Tax=Phytohabitans sp. LJ34 TaxID=3452217 RepID=UPI003F889B9C